MNANRWLVLVLRIEGGFMLLALGAVFFPDSWMEAGHKLAGLGDYPQSSITEYLARSLSLLYAGVGVLVLVISFDLEHYRRLIVYMGVGPARQGGADAQADRDVFVDSAARPQLSAVIRQAARDLSVTDARSFSPVESRQRKLKTRSTIEKPAVQPKIRHRSGECRERVFKLSRVSRSLETRAVHRYPWEEVTLTRRAR